MRPEQLFRDAWPLAALAAAVALLLAGVDAMTRERIADNEMHRTRQMLAEMMGLSADEDDPLAGVMLHGALPTRFGICFETPDSIRRFNFKSDGAIGYGGRIRYLLSTDDEGRISGVRIIGHVETPGLGDLMEPEKSDWLAQFTGRHPDDADWALAMDGGALDALSGATITSRAMVQGLAASTAVLAEAADSACDYVVDQR
jgi:Na+-translocating ferredoxin:NAD+ oxidoreductase subunit G